MNRFVAAALAVVTGGLGLAVGAKPKPPPYDPGRQVVTASKVVVYPDGVDGAFPGTAERTVTAVCPAGKVPSGGGGRTAADNRFTPEVETSPDVVAIVVTYPASTGSWTVTAHGDALGVDVTVTAYAVCVNP